MKILFSPEYSGTVYVKAANESGVMMDTVVLNIIGLVNMLELRLGLHYESLPELERMAHYYDAVRRYMAEHPGNVMSDSFNTSSLNTAKSMLRWRDELRGAQWDFGGEEISNRLAVLIGVEELFCEYDGCDMAARMQIVTDKVSLQELNCKDMTIELSVAKELLKPAVRTLLDALESHGATIVLTDGASDTDNNLSRVRQMIASKQKGKITLDKDDDSLMIWKFADEHLACEYLSYNKMEDVDVWVNADNKQMDNWLKLMGRATTGSVTSDCVPQLTQLFVMGLGLFDTPLNVNTLIEWLNMPVHPIGGPFRYVLAERIVQEGGYRNESCRKIIELFIDGMFVYLDDKQMALSEEEQQAIRLKDKSERIKQVDLFLPPLVSSQTIKTEDVRCFVCELSAWASQRAHLMAETPDNKQWVEQLLTFSGMCDAFRILLGTIDNETIEYKTIDSWMSTVYGKGAYTNAIAERGCRTVVDSPAKIASVAKKTIWIGVDGDVSHTQECAFLYPTEKMMLSQKHNICPWDDDAQNDYNEQQMLTPLRMTNGQLILVVRERMGGEPSLKHPLIVRLEQQIKNISDFICYPKVDDKDRSKVKQVENGGISAELKFKYAGKIQWPDHLGPTVLGTLAEYPFDYLMERVLCITNDGTSQMADVKTTQGNVAHAVIEELFAPRNGARHSTPQEIAERITREYEKSYTTILEAKGAILQLAENKLAQKLFHEQLRSCVDTLLSILKENDLKVTDCEHRVESQMDLGLPHTLDKEGNVKERDIIGVIDMTLEDKDGSPVLFDFKWTKSSKVYQNKLTENRSVQLEVYRWMLSREKNTRVKRVAYFLMPEARLYSCELFKGRYCTQLTAENGADIVQQLMNSAKYRIAQIKSGILETNGFYDELKYVKDTQAKDLYPLKMNEGNNTKEENYFTLYENFNN